MKVTILAREIQAPYKYIGPTWDGKKLVPYGGQFYLRYSRHGRQMITPAGNDPADVLRQRETMLATLQAEKAGLVVNGGIATPAMPTPIAAAPRVTIQEMIDAYLDDLRLAKRPAGTISDKQLHLRLFTTLANKQDLAAYGRPDVLRMKNHLEADGYASKTVDNYMMSVAVFFNGLKIELGMKKLDWPVVTDNDPEPYEADEVVSLIAKADSRMALVIRTFVGTGMRDMELAHLTWEDIDFKHKLIHIQPKPCHCRKCGSVGVWKPKTKEGTRNIPLGDGLLADLAKIKTGEGLVFPSPRDGKVDGKLLAKLGSVAKKAGVAAPKLHRFRDTFITNKIRDGVDIRTVQKWAGHKDIRRGWLRTAWPLALRLTARTNAISLPKVCEIANSVRGTCLWRIDTVAVKRSDPRNVLQLS